MCIHDNVTGADTVLCWQTGYPYNVKFSRSYPRYNPGEYSANDPLERHKVDACLLIVGESLPEISTNARDHLNRIPTNLLEYPTVEPLFQPSIGFTTSVYSVHLLDSAYRGDELRLSLRQVLTRMYPSDADVQLTITRSTTQQL